VTDVTAARAALQNIGTALDTLSAQGSITATAEQALELRLSGITEAINGRDYQDAARRAADLDAAIEAFAADGDMAPSAELLGEVDKLRSALPPV